MEYKVTGYSHLVKRESGGVVNNDKSAYAFLSLLITPPVSLLTK